LYKSFHDRLRIIYAFFFPSFLFLTLPLHLEI
jgi:hypothetical protein